jgi:hypothetical protein
MIWYINIYYKPVARSMSIPCAINDAIDEIELAEPVELVNDEEDIDTGLAEEEEDREISRLTLDTASSFDVILNKKIEEINELYELKIKNKKMTSNANEINFMDKKLYNKINAAIDKKYKESKQYKKKCEEEVQNAL